MADKEINKIVYGEDTLIDLTEDTVTEDALLNGYTAHSSSGRSITGSVVVPKNLNDLNDVDVSSPTDKQVLTYDSASNSWMAKNSEGGQSDIDLSVVDGKLNQTYGTETDTTDPIILDETLAETNRKLDSIASAIQIVSGNSIASKTKLGSVQIGDNLSITPEGVLSADAQSYDLPVADSTTLGGVKVGSNLEITDGVLKVKPLVQFWNKSCNLMTTLVPDTQPLYPAIITIKKTDFEKVFKNIPYQNILIQTVKFDVNGVYCIPMSRLQPTLSSGTECYTFNGLFWRTDETPQTVSKVYLEGVYFPE